MATLVCFLVASCKDSPKENKEELETAKQDLLDAQSDLQESVYDSVTDYQAFRESFEVKILENEKRLEEMKKGITASKRVGNLEKEKELSKLEAQNIMLKAKIQDFELGTFEKWELFKIDLNKELDEVGKSISEMADRNKKS